MKTALITGITGQDGSYLAELLLSKDYIVHGIVRPLSSIESSERYKRIYHLMDRIHLHSGSVENYASMFNILKNLRPDECYHLAAQSFVADSFKDEFTTFDVNVNGTHNILSLLHDFHPHCKFYFAGSSEMYGNVSCSLQDETTPFRPVSPYGVSKLSGYELTKFYRNTFNMFACSGILFNHESPRRGWQFVSKKIVSSAAKIRFEKQKELSLGNIDIRRDWGFAPDYVRAMWLMLQRPTPGDYVIATGETHSLREFLELAFDGFGLDYTKYIKIDPQLYRPVDISTLCGDATKANKMLGWEPLVNFKNLIQIMIDYEYTHYNEH